MDRIRIAYIGDSPFIFSGFGVVANAILSRIPKDEFEISALGTMYPYRPKDTKYIDDYEATCIHDLMGYKSAIDFIRHTDPDIMFFIGDPGTLYNRFQTLMLSGIVGRFPMVTYFPIEGAPPSPVYAEQAMRAQEPVTYTKWGKEILYQTPIDGVPCEVDYIYHGADHANFRPYDEDTKMALKRAVGWEDKFVIGMVGMNKRTNRQPALLQAALELKRRGRKDFIIYMHCQSSGESVLQGWELGWQIESYDVEDVIQVKPDQKEHKYIARPREGTLDFALGLGRPKDADEARHNLSILDFISLLNLFDVYIDPASAHGWNLPACEAARCGVPIITVDDRFARSEIFSSCAYMMQPTAYDHWHTGAILPLVSPKAIADAIEDMWDNEDKRKQYAKSCKERFDALKWQDSTDKFIDKFKKVHEYGLEMAFGSSNSIKSIDQ